MAASSWRPVCSSRRASEAWNPGWVGASSTARGTGARLPPGRPGRGGPGRDCCTRWVIREQLHGPGELVLGLPQGGRVAGLQRLVEVERSQVVVRLEDPTRERPLHVAPERLRVVPDLDLLPRPHQEARPPPAPPRRAIRPRRRRLHRQPARRGSGSRGTSTDRRRPRPRVGPHRSPGQGSAGSRPMRPGRLDDLGATPKAQRR